MIQIRYCLIFSSTVFYFLIYCSTWTAARNAGVTVPTTVHVGVILATETWNGIMSRQCVSMAVEDFYAKHHHYQTRLVLHISDANDVGTAVLKAVDMLKDAKVQVIVGPQMSTQAEVVAELGNKAQVPVISFSATSPSLPSTQVPYFIQMAHNDTYQLQAIGSLIKTCGWKEVVLIYEETDYGNDIIPYLTDTFKTIGVRVLHRISIVPDATDHQIHTQLFSLLSVQKRVFIVHMLSPLGPRFFLRVKEAGLMTEGNTWIITEGLTNFLGSMEDFVFNSMRGVLGVKPYISRSKELRNFKVRMSMKILQESSKLGDLNIFCLHAYDSIWAIAMAAERLVSTDHSFKNQITYNKKADFLGLGISEVGPDLLKEILNSKFEGLSGEIRIVDGQLQPPLFQIINVFGHEDTVEIGFRIPTDARTGTIRGHIICPDKPTTVDTGHATPPSRQKLRIVYPVKNTFIEFVQVRLNRNSNKTNVTGYCIEIFKAAMKALPYDVPYEFVPFQTDNVENGINYDDLIRQVFYKKYDAVVGDITITSDRSLHLDFSHSFNTQGGVAMVIPIKYDNRTSLLTIFEPFSMNVWLSYLAVSVITIFVIWSFEHASRHGPGVPVIDQILRVLAIAWMLLSAPFNPTGNLKNVTKFVVVIFIIASLLLFGLFMQILPNILIDDNHQLTMLDAKDFLNNGDFVGYQKGSVVKTLLIKQLHFPQSQLKVYNSLDECHEALQKGSKNGGVAAIFDEMPYIRLLLNKFRGKYTRVGPIYGQQGFGFGFPKGSSLVSDVSMAISALVESGQREKIESIWLGSETTTLDPPQNSSPSHNKISLDKIWGLFVIFLLVIFSVLLLFLIAQISSPENKLVKVLRDIFQIGPDQPGPVQEELQLQEIHPPEHHPPGLEEPDEPELDPLNAPDANGAVDEQVPLEEIDIHPGSVQEELQLQEIHPPEHHPPGLEEPDEPEFDQ